MCTTMTNSLPRWGVHPNDIVFAVDYMRLNVVVLEASNHRDPTRMSVHTAAPDLSGVAPSPCQYAVLAFQYPPTP